MTKIFGKKLFDLCFSALKIVQHSVSVLLIFKNHPLLLTTVDKNAHRPLLSRKVIPLPCKNKILTSQSYSLTHFIYKFTA